MAGTRAQVEKFKADNAAELTQLKAQLATVDAGSERADNLRTGIRRREAAIQMCDEELKVHDALQSGRAGREAGSFGDDGASYVDGNPLEKPRPVGKDVSMVELLKQAGRTVNDQEWRWGMLGSVVLGKSYLIERYTKHLGAGPVMTMPDGAKLDRHQTKDMLIGSSAGTATLTPDVVSAQLIDRMRARTVVVELGALTVPMTSDTAKVPRITGDPTVSWLAEGATVTASDATLDSVNFTARRLTGLTKASQELVEDSDPVNVGRVLEVAFGGALAVELDRVALKGSGTPPEPQGIRNQSGVSVNATAAAASWAVVAERIGVLVGLNVPVEALGVAVNPASWTTIMSQAEAGGQPIARPPFLENLRILPTSSLAAPATGELYAGNYSELMIGVRIGLDFQILRERYADEGKVGFLPRVRADVQVMHGQSFALRTALSS